MGQQQLFLIVIGLVLVSVAVLFGMYMFSNMAEASNVDQTSAELLKFAVSAREYYHRPRAMGGGGRRFTGFTLRTDSTTNATYLAAIAAGGQIMTITGTCLTAKQKADPDQAAYLVVTVQPRSTTLSVSQ